ncbi:DUF6049 family protein [Streptomyces beihaiensis]|uniref:DUF6049 family protein n=1 Tax=Streptomyces beihaiensis TaxID=2984495 RepID=A0ABT3TZ37_9ACTN|nr:DUF6049 family protein [Streptomyces beihaiensis]MCX3062312.1 DUF6049 family protein [Streptomyces beihaiensis]
MARNGAAARAWIVSAMVLGASALPGAAGRAHAADDDPVKAAVVWPVTATPHMTAAALGSGSRAQPVFDDDALADQFADGGRLREVVDAGKGHDVAWAVDPDLVIAAQAMADGYRVADSADSSNPQDSSQGTGQSAAKSWLADLKDAVDGHDVWLLPFADPDLASLAHHPGTDTDDLTDVVSGLADDARKQVDKILGTGTHAGLGWPADGALDSTITATAARLGVTRLLTSGQGLSPDGADPVRLRSGDDELTALPYDDRLTAALARIRDEGGGAQDGQSSTSPSPSTPPPSDPPASSDPPSPSPSASASASDTSGSARTPDSDTVDHLADLLGTSARPVVVPPRALSGAAAQALAAAIDSGTDDGKFELEGLSDAGRDPVDGKARASWAYPAGLRSGELTSAQLTDVAGTLDRLATLTKVLAYPDATASSVHAAMARALSTAWRAQDDSAHDTFQQRTSDFLSTSVESLRLVPKTTVTLTSGDAKVPVTVDNGLQQPVAGLELRVTSGDSERLKVNDSKVPVEAAGSATHTNQIGVTAKANGKAELTAQLYSISDGRPWGDPITFDVDVTSVSTGAIVVVAAGVGLIVLAAAFRMRNVRRRRDRLELPDE